MFRRKIVFRVSLLLATMLFVSCASTHKSQLVSELTVITSSSLKAEIEVDMNKVLTGESTSKFLFNFFQLEGPSEFADGYGESNSNTGKTKSAAAYNAMKNSDADVLVSPQYIVKVEGNPFITSINVIVSGYAGYIKSIK